jgi:hypothetical protein
MAFPDIDRSLFSADVVQIRKSGETESAYPSARPVKATVSETARLMTHPLEDGTPIADHRIRLPNAITLIIIIDPKLFTFRPIDLEFGFLQTYKDTYQRIKDDFDKNQKFTIQTKAGSYENMYLQGIPHEEDATQFDTITIILDFLEAKFAKVQTQELAPPDVQNANDTSTMNTGEQTTTESKGSVLIKIKNFF